MRGAICVEWKYVRGAILCGMVICVRGGKRRMWLGGFEGGVLEEFWVW